MRRVLTYATVAVALAIPASALASTSSTPECPGCVTLLRSVVGPFLPSPAWGNAGVSRFLKRDWWANRHGLTSVPPGTPVYEANVPGVAAAAQALEVAQARFVTLYLAFPRSPTRAQWKARYRPLIRQAIAVDNGTLATLAIYVSGQSAINAANLTKCIQLGGGDRSECPIPNEPVNLYDSIVQDLQADRAALVALLGVGFPGS